MTLKQRVMKTIESLPEDCTIEDVQYRLYVMEVIRRRTAEAKRSKPLTHAHALKRVKKWLPK